MKTAPTTAGLEARARPPPRSADAILEMPARRAQPAPSARRERVTYLDNLKWLLVEKCRDQLDILLRHRLLPQPTGFEGFATRSKRLDATHSAAIEVEELEEGVIEGDAARSADADRAAAHENTVWADG